MPVDLDQALLQNAHGRLNPTPRCFRGFAARRAGEGAISRTGFAVKARLDVGCGKAVFRLTDQGIDAVFLDAESA
ncbi:MAG: hypothetical protein K2Z25_12655 [Beijerinckiaceae bacterium]|nr:hypothetical protein [Beijerinckiaceae bacterium]